MPDADSTSAVVDVTRYEVEPTARRQIGVWLLIVATLVFGMVVLGGTTRLTHSGLSMVDWRPIMGSVPPLSAAAWETVFAQYKAYPEYQKFNQGMTLSEFKSIFWFEYSHRMLGRLIGLAFFLPFIWFLWRRRVSFRLALTLLGLFLLGGLQGLIGWWMVKSGLVDRPDVSHYRLTIHLALALVILGALLWVSWDLLLPAGAATAPVVGGGLRIWAAVGACSVFLQALSGGLVAGLDAGLHYNTFPTMNGLWFPPELWQQEPWWQNLLENPTTVQFDHRLGAYLATLIFAGLWLAARRRALPRHARLAITFVMLVLAGQLALGVLVLVHIVPIPLGVAHQAGALLLFSSALYTVHRLSPSTRLAISSLRRDVLAHNGGGR